MQIAERNVPREDLECDDLKVVKCLMCSLLDQKITLITHLNVHEFMAL